MVWRGRAPTARCALNAPRRYHLGRRVDSPVVHPHRWTAPGVRTSRRTSMRRKATGPRRRNPSCVPERRNAPLCQAGAPGPGHAPALSRSPFRTTPIEITWAGHFQTPPDAPQHRQAPLKHPDARGARRGWARQASQGTANASRSQQAHPARPTRDAQAPCRDDKKIREVKGARNCSVKHAMNTRTNNAPSFSIFAKDRCGSNPEYAGPAHRQYLPSGQFRSKAFLFRVCGFHPGLRTCWTSSICYSITDRISDHEKREHGSIGSRPYNHQDFAPVNKPPKFHN